MSAETWMVVELARRLVRGEWGICERCNMVFPHDEENRLLGIYDDDDDRESGYQCVECLVR